MVSESEDLVTTVFPCGATNQVLRSAWNRVQRKGKVRLMVWDERPGKKMLNPPQMPDGSPLRCTSGCSAPERRAWTTEDENRDFVDGLIGECVCVLAAKESET